MKLFLTIIFIYANSEDPDEIPPYAAFHLGLHGFSKHTCTYLLVFSILLRIPCFFVIEKKVHY